MVLPPHKRRAEYVLYVISVLKQCDTIKNVVIVLPKGPDETSLFTAHRNVIYTACKSELGCKFVVLETAILSDWCLLNQVQSIHSKDELATCLHQTSSFYPVSSLDVGLFAAYCICRPQALPNVANSYTLVGKEAISMREVAEWSAEIIGRKIGVRACSQQELWQRLAPLSTWMAQATIECLTDLNHASSCNLALRQCAVEFKGRKETLHADIYMLQTVPIQRILRQILLSGNSPQTMKFPRSVSNVQTVEVKDNTTPN
jgi:hypothetical protein